MNQSVSSEFEKERQRILAEIEARARKQGGQLTLQEWLKAAEEVMPDEQARSAGDDAIVSLSTRARRPHQDTSDISTEHVKEENRSMESLAPATSRKNLFYAVFVGGVVVLLMVAAGALAYVHLNRQLQEMAETTRQLQQALQQVETRLDNLDKQKAVPGAPDLTAVLERLKMLEQQVAGNENMPLNSEHLGSVTDQVRAELNEANVVTEAVLDAKLEQFSQRIEQAIDKRFATILAQLKNLRSLQQEEKSSPQSSLQVQQSESEIAVPHPPAGPVVPAVEIKKTEPQSAMMQMPLPDETWLASQPAANWTLQLASVLDRGSLEQLKKSKGLDQARIVRQQRSGRMFYVLILGSYGDRAEAKRQANEIRMRTGINPWIRPMRDLQKKLPH